MAKISYHIFFFKYHNFKIVCHVDFTIASEQCSQNSLPITKTNHFKVTKYKNVWWIFRPKWGKIKIFVIILSLLLKIRTNIHITNTHNIQIKQTVLYFSGTIGIFSRNIQEIE